MVLLVVHLQKMKEPRKNGLKNRVLSSIGRGWRELPNSVSIRPSLVPAVLTFFFTVFVRTFSQMVRIAIGQARKEAAAQKNVIKFFALISMPLLLSREYNFLPTQDSGHCMA